MEALRLGWVGTVDRVSWRSQDHNMLFIRTSRQLSVRGKNPPAALAALRAADRMRACVRFVLRARSVWTRNSSVAFTDVYERRDRKRILDFPKWA